MPVFAAREVLHPPLVQAAHNVLLSASLDTHLRHASATMRGLLQGRNVPRRAMVTERTHGSGEDFSITSAACLTTTRRSSSNGMLFLLGFISSAQNAIVASLCARRSEGERRHVELDLLVRARINGMRMKGIRGKKEMFRVF